MPRLRKNFAFHPDDIGLVREFTDKDLSDLHQLLAYSRNPDAYCRSYLYYALTGRGRVWLIEDDGAKIICTEHPNTPGNLLVFFPFVYSVTELESQIKTLNRRTNFLSNFSRIFLARINKKICNKFFSSNSKGGELFFQKLQLRRVPEKTLDWIFPSYDIDVEKLERRFGADLACFRNKIRKFDSSRLEIKSLDKMTSDQVADAICGVSANWAHLKYKRQKSKADFESFSKEVTDPYVRLANLCYTPGESNHLGGLFLKRDDEYIGFALWEEPHSRTQTVPAIAALPRSYEKGLSEYLHYQVAQKLVLRGYKSMCIGGSETDGLDRFKRKLAPAIEHELCTVRLILRHYDAVWPSPTQIAERTATHKALAAAELSRTP